MPTIVVLERHSPETCAWLNEEIRKADWYISREKHPALLEKHGIKRLGAWYIEPTEHLSIYVYDVPSLDAFQKYLMEPDLRNWIAHQVAYEVKVAMTGEDAKNYWLGKPP